MGKLVAAINMTLDGFCDHTAVNADDEMHDYYTELLRSAGAVLYGRVTYQLMESYWPSVVTNPTGNRSTDEFASAIQDVSKIVFSRTLKGVSWHNAKLAAKGLEQEASDLKRQLDKDVFLGSPSLIAALTELDIIDEYQLNIHPVIAGSGLPLFKGISRKIELKHIRSKTLRGLGAVIHYYERNKG
ncbi:MAG TPA: dihydrofolate reductase family protein [Chryseolinea sp.]